MLLQKQAKVGKFQDFVVVIINNPQHPIAGFGSPLKRGLIPSFPALTEL